MNFDRLRHVAERADLGAEREALLAVEIPEQPGSFLRFCEVLGAAQRHRVQLPLTPAPRARRSSSASPSRQGRAEKDAVIASLRAAASRVIDMTDNEMAKLHVRYMVGGHARGIADELLYRFEFPERPGALLTVPARRSARAGTSRCSTTAITARTTAACSPASRCRRPSAREFLLHLNELHYAYVEETANPAYRMFLGT